MHSSNQNERYMSIELELYRELRLWVDETAYFAARDISNLYESGQTEFYITFMDDCLELMLDIYNVRQFKTNILDDLREEIERHLFFEYSVQYKRLMFDGNRIFVECWR